MQKNLKKQPHNEHNLPVGGPRVQWRHALPRLHAQRQKKLVQPGLKGRRGPQAVTSKRGDEANETPKRGRGCSNGGVRFAPKQNRSGCARRCRRRRRGPPGPLPGGVQHPLPPGQPGPAGGGGRGCPPHTTHRVVGIPVRLWVPLPLQEAGPLLRPGEPLWRDRGAMVWPADTEPPHGDWGRGGATH